MSYSEFHRYVKEVFMCTQSGVTLFTGSQLTAL